MNADKQVRVGVGVIVKKEGRVLMQKRKGAHGEGSWSFPGGHLEFNEGIEECAKREVEEETGIKIKNLRLGPYTNDVFEKEGRHYITLFVLAEYDSGEISIKETDKTEEIEWFDIEEIPRELFLPIENLLKIYNLNEDMKNEG